MKKRLFVIFAMLSLLGLAVAAYAFTKTTNSSDASVSCCKKGESCPMKGKKDHGNTGDHAKGEQHNCCGDSCPMKNKDANAKADGHSCDCCGDSCPMKKKDGEAKATAVSTTADEKKSCCDNCDCCKGKHKETAV